MKVNTKLLKEITYKLNSIRTGLGFWGFGPKPKPKTPKPRGIIKYKA